ncbi:MAG: hypothetical protein LBD68_05210, partial [Zoogloeaceae bacterium]|nr:hypothetical protein [Zoogloeaceae bacterium]
APRSQPPLEIIDDKRAPSGPDSTLRFVLGALTVEGATVFSSEELTAPYSDRYGKEVSLAEALAIAEAMTRRYRAAGYLLSRVILPTEQGALDPANAHLRLTALEGYISAARIEGDPALVARFRSYWADAKARLLAQKPLKHADFEREMLLLSDLPGIRVSSRFEADEEGGAGASLLVLELLAKPLEGSLSLGNSGTKSAGRGLLTVSAGFSWPLIGSHSAVSYTQARVKGEYAAWSFAHTHRFANGLGVNASWAKSESPKPDSDFARIFDYETASRTFAADVDYPLIRGRDKNLSMGLSYEHRNGRSDLLDAPYARDRLRSLTWEINYDVSDAFLGGGVTQIMPAVTRGLDWFDATDQSPEASSPQAPARFTRYRLYLSRTQNLPARFSLAGSFSAQRTNAPLTSYYRESLGGSQYGRGYAPGVIENDNSLAASIEARRDVSLAALSLQPYVFLDWGKTWAHGRTAAGDRGEEYLASAGIGARLFGQFVRAPAAAAFAPRFSLNIFYARPLRAAGEVDTSDQRIFVQGALSF